MRSSLVIFVAACTLPLVFAGGGLICQTCTSSPLLSPSQCNMSDTEDDCGSNKCMALTAELSNGTVVGMRGCSNAAQCNISACGNGNQSLSGGVYFKRCIAECCDQESCNKDLFPILPEMPYPEPDPTSVQAMASSNGPVTKASTTQATKRPTSASIKIKAIFFLPFLMPIIIDITM